MLPESGFSATVGGLGAGGRNLGGVSRYKFALKPKWILGHVIVIALVVGFVNAGFWQIRRLHQRQAFNRSVVANMHKPVATLDDVLPRSAGFADVPDQLDRRVRATGHYLIDDEVVITAQANPEGVPGVWLVTPLQLDNGRVVLVNRGWLPSTGGITRPPPDARPPSGRVTVTGLVSETETQSAGESRETNKAHQESFLRIDIARIQRQFTQKLAPAFLLRQSQQPPDAGARKPQNLDPPELDNGPHLSYTIQWFSFTALALIGYPTLLWIIGRERKHPKRDVSEPENLPPGAFVDADGVLDLTGVAEGVDGSRQDSGPDPPDH